MSNLQDRRVRKTNAALLEALITLLKEKDFQQISVSELCSLADINRGTFYLHYRDIYDMMDFVEHDLIRRFEEATSSDIFKKDFTHAREFFQKSYEFLAENEALLTAVLGPHGDSSFQKNFTEHLRSNFETLYRNQVEVTCDSLYFFTYLLSGTTSLMASWILSGKRESPQQMAELSLKFIVHGISAFVAL